MTVPHRHFPPRGDKPMQAPVDEEELVATYERNEDAVIPFYVDPFVGYRAWSIVHREEVFWLRSVTYSTFWPMREEMHAACQNQHLKCSSSPNPFCSCGIYVVKELQSAKTWATHGSSHFRVIGEVKIWGRILQYERGFIVEYAYPDRIWVTDDYSYWKDSPGFPEASPEEIAVRLEEAYGVEVSVGWPDSE